MNDASESKALVATKSLPPAERSGTLPATAEPFGRAIVVPKLVADAGDKAARRCLTVGFS